MIKENTKGSLTKIMVNDFSTTSAIEKCTSESILMSQVQKYFEYHGRGICGCGITKVHFLGTLEDW